MENILFLSKFVIILLLTLCCRTGSLLTVHPTYQEQYSNTSVNITCHFSRSQCPTHPMWSGPALKLNHAYLRHTNTESVLKIDNVQTEDEGLYHCSCGNRNTTADLQVLHLPSFHDVPPHQSFYGGDQARINCPADHGDPDTPMIWLYNGYSISLSGPRFSRFRIHRQFLTIDNISDSDSGMYLCGFNTPLRGLISRTINVTVSDPPPGQIKFNFPSFVTVRFGEGMELECNTTPHADRIHWVDNHNVTINSHTIHLEEEGTYTCFAQVRDRQVSRSIMVEIINIPPRLLQENSTRSSTTLEGGTHELDFSLQHYLDNHNLSFKWRKDNVAVSMFDQPSRLTYDVSDHGIRVHIANAAVTDQGTYTVNVSNRYGWDTINVTLNVDKLMRTPLKLKFKDISCATLQEQRSNVSDQVVRQYRSCNDCGVVRTMPDEIITITCLPDNNIAVLSLTLLSQDALPNRTAFALRIGGAMIEAIVCEGSCTTEQMTTTSEAPTVTGEKGSIVPSTTGIVGGVVVAVVIVLAVVFTIFIIRLKNRHHCSNDIGDRTMEPPHEVVVVNNQRYTAVDDSPTRQPHKQTVTPAVCEPFLPQPQANGTPPTRPKRPQHLMFNRSHSYQGSRRPIQTV